MEPLHSLIAYGIRNRISKQVLARPEVQSCHPAQRAPSHSRVNSAGRKVDPQKPIGLSINEGAALLQALLAHPRLSPVCLHAVSIEGLPFAAGQPVEVPVIRKMLNPRLPETRVSAVR
jgi:hypothetical protein